MINLDKEAERERLSVTDQIALQDADLRKWMADRVVPAFLKANGLTLAAVAVLVVLDEINIASHLIAPGDRIITEKAIMALLGATTVQVGAIAALIARRQVKPDGRADAFLAGDANMTPALFGKTIDH